MSGARHHNEWLSLVEASGPFLSMEVLLRVFPQELDVPHQPELHRTLRLAYEEWADSQEGKPDQAIHTVWLKWVLENLLDYRKDMLLSGPQIPAGLIIQFGEYGERLGPDLVLQNPAEPKPRLLIKTYPSNQKLEKPLVGTNWPASPAERMRQLLRRTEVRLGLITNGEHWMLVHALPAAKDEPASYISWYASAWLEEPLTQRAFRTLLRSYRFFSVADNNTLEALFEESSNNQQSVTDQLGYQVRRAVEMLVQRLDQIDKNQHRQLLAGITEQELYEAALTFMMRLVFLISAEDREMLPVKDSALYQRNYAVSTLLEQLRATGEEEILQRRHDAYSRLLATFRMVYGGISYPDLNLPAYGGELFDPDRYPFLEGRKRGTKWQESKAHPLPISNRTVLHLLEALQMLQVKVPGGGVEKRRLSFRALDIEQIGHVYEGLLDHNAFRAKEPVLGLKGPKDSEEEILLGELEQKAAGGLDKFVAYLKDRTNRSENALRKDLSYKPDFFRVGALRAACDNDEKLLERVLPFAGLVRDDDFGNPVVITANSVYVTQGSDRRSTGTHYTPRSLTEPLVKHALDPLVYLGPAEGKPEEEWQLRSARELLNLKICDMAMGSGAFLVQACRYMSEKLVSAWERETIAPTEPPIDPDTTDTLAELISENPTSGAVSKIPGLAEGELLPVDREEQLALARRVVAERCLYGVDKNPMAVEMAKLSLWLITLDKKQPFTFLNHALRSGDSLLGVTSTRQLTNWSIGEVEHSGLEVQSGFVQEMVRKALGKVLAARGLIKRLPVNAGARINEQKARLLREAEEQMALVKLGADLLVAETLAAMSRDRISQDALFLEYTVLGNSYETYYEESGFEGGQAREEGRKAYGSLRAKVDELLQERTPFHWLLEFPEVFAAQSENSGFDVLIGNPPFQGGSMISSALGLDYRDFLVIHIANGKRGLADLCSYFFLRLNHITRANCFCGLLATNTIAQGETRTIGIEQLISNGWTIIRTVPTRPWPGIAGVHIAHVWLTNQEWKGLCILDEDRVESITSHLAPPNSQIGKTFPLFKNLNIAFKGSEVYGIGFALDPEEAETLLAKDPRNREVIFPYLNGDDLNSKPDQSPSRWVINFRSSSLEIAETYPDCLKIVRERVKPDRDKLVSRDSSGRDRAKRWWQFGRPTETLYNTIQGLERVLVVVRHTKYLVFNWEPTTLVYSEATVVVAVDGYKEFVNLQNTFHELWARDFGSSLGNTMRYTPSDSFESFPFSILDDFVGKLGETYYLFRQSIMLNRKEGLTDIYNRFHNPNETSPDIQKLRELHVEMDHAVAAAYGWHDLALEHGFHQTKQGLRYTISEAARREVLGRLLQLNHQRHAEEVATGLVDESGKPIKKNNTPKRGKNQQSTAKNTTPSTSSNGSQSSSAPTQGKLFDVEPAGSLWEWGKGQEKGEQ